MGRSSGNGWLVRCKFGERPALKSDPTPSEARKGTCRDYNHPPKVRDNKGEGIVQTTNRKSSENYSGKA